MINKALVFQLFVLLNPLTAAPLLIMLHKRGVKVRPVAFSATVTAFLVALAIAVGGKYLFEIFQITTHSFRIAGGIVVLLLGLETIRGHDDDKPPDGGLDNFVAILATPILTGPATMSFVTLKAYEMEIWLLVIHLILAFVGVAGVMYILCMSLDRINTRLIGIISRVLGLFLTAMGVEMMAAGIEGLIHKG